MEVGLVLTLDVDRDSTSCLLKTAMAVLSVSYAKTTTGEVASRPLSFTVKLIRQEKMYVNDEYMESVIDLMGLRG